MASGLAEAAQMSGPADEAHFSRQFGNAHLGNGLLSGWIAGLIGPRARRVAPAVAMPLATLRMRPRHPPGQRGCAQQQCGGEEEWCPRQVPAITRRD